MEFNFKKTMKETPGSELIRIIITNRDEYQEAAIGAADIELARKGLAQDELQKLKTRDLWENGKTAFKVTLPLEIYWKILSFLLPGLFQLILAGYFKANGYDKKASDVGKWTISVCFFT